MRFAVIAPTPELRLTRGTGLHLVLSHQLKDEHYSTFYRECSQRGDYLILDNSTYEQQYPVSAQRLSADAAALSADEIVVPDKLGDCEETLRLAGEAFDAWSSKPGSTYLALLKPRFLLTPQGRTLEEWRTCLFGLVLRWRRFVRANPELHQHEEATIGLSTRTVTELRTAFRGPEHSYTVDYVLEYFLHDYHRQGFAIHLFGVLGGFKLWDLNRVARQFPWVRSVDTTKPIVYAMNGILLDPERPEPAYPHRPDDYFDRRLTTDARGLAIHNIGVCRKLAAGAYKEVASERSA